MKDIFICIRNSNERTLHASADLIQGMFGKTVEFVSEEPFSSTFLTGAKNAIDSSARLALFVDADVLALPNLHQFVSEFDSSNSRKYWGASPLVFDKFFQQYRSAGVHLYKTEFLEVGYRQLFVNENSELEGFRSHVRPETFFKRIVAQKTALNWGLSGLCVGLHDFEQEYSDLFRKGLQYSAKFPKQFASTMDHWLETEDKDYKALLAGFRYGLGNREDQVFGVTASNNIWINQIESNALGKKDPLTVLEAKEIVSQYLRSNSYISKKIVRMSIENISKENKSKRIRNTMRRYGFIKGFLLLSMRFLEKSNSKIQKPML